MIGFIRYERSPTPGSASHLPDGRPEVSIMIVEVGQFRSSFYPFNKAKAVHVRHMHIGEDKAIRFVGRGRSCISGQGCRSATAVSDSSPNFVRMSRESAGWSRCRPRSSTAAPARWSARRPRVCNFARSESPEPHREVECAPRPDLALDPDVAAHHLDQSLDEIVRPSPVPPYCAGRRAVGLRRTTRKIQLCLSRRDADSRVGHT